MALSTGSKSYGEYANKMKEIADQARKEVYADKTIIVTITKKDGDEATFSMKKEDLWGIQKDSYNPTFISLKIRRISKRPQTVETVYIPWSEIKQLIVQEDEDGND